MSKTSSLPRLTVISVPVQRSSVRQSVPRTGAAAKRPFVRKLPLALPQAWRTGLGFGFAAPLAYGVVAALSLAYAAVIQLDSAALTAGTGLGGWRIIRTVGRRIYRIHPLEGLSSQTSSAGVILGASLLGAPVSTSQVVASSVVGIGAGRRRLRHVNWWLVRQIGLAWVITLPASAALAAVLFGLLQVLT